MSSAALQRSQSQHATWGLKGKVETGFDSLLSPASHGNCGFLAFEAEGKLVVSDNGNHHIQVLRFFDGAHLRTICGQGSGNGQFLDPCNIAFDGTGHILVANQNNHRGQMLKYSDGAHVRTIGSSGSGNGPFDRPRGDAVYGEQRVVVCECINYRLQVLE